MRLTLPVTTGEHVEVMTFDFEEVGPNTTTLTFKVGHDSSGIPDHG